MNDPARSSRAVTRSSKMAPPERASHNRTPSTAPCARIAATGAATSRSIIDRRRDAPARPLRSGDSDVPRLERERPERAREGRAIRDALGAPEPEIVAAAAIDRDLDTIAAADVAPVLRLRVQDRRR